MMTEAEYTLADIRTAVRRFKQDAFSARLLGPAFSSLLSTMTLVELSEPQLLVYDKLITKDDEREARQMAERIASAEFHRIDRDDLTDEHRKILRSMGVDPDAIAGIVVATSPDCADPSCPVHGANGISLPKPPREPSREDL